MAKVKDLALYARKSGLRDLRAEVRLLAELVLDSGNHLVVSRGTGLSSEQGFVDLVTMRLGKNPAAQRRLFGLLVGPSPKRVFLSGPDPVRAEADGRAIDAVIDAASRGRGNHARYAQRRVDLTILPAIAVEQTSVRSVPITKHEVEPSKDKRRKPDGDDSATLPPVPPRPIPTAAAELGESVANELKRRPLGHGSVKFAGLSDLEAALTHAKSSYAEATAPVIEALNEYLATLEGLTLEELSLNKRLASKVAAFARSLGLRFECPKCSKPSNLSISKVRGMDSGAFRFKHAGSSPGSQVSHGGSRAIPRLRLIPPIQE